MTEKITAEKITAEEFLNKEEAFLRYVVKQNRIIVNNTGYDPEDVFQEVALGVIEFFEKFGTPNNMGIPEVEFPLSSEYAYEMAMEINRCLNPLKRMETIVFIPYGNMHRNNGNLSEMTNYYSRMAQLDYVPLHISSGTETCANPISDRIQEGVTLDERIGKIVYSDNDIKCDTLDEEIVLKETFCEEQNDSELIINIINFVDNLKNNERKAIHLWAEGYTQLEAEEICGLHHKRLRTLVKKMKKLS